MYMPCINNVAATIISVCSPTTIVPATAGIYSARKILYLPSEEGRKPEEKKKENDI